jgi:cytochrome o ubiquinol oxidase operon protein cyoD
MKKLTANDKGLVRSYLIGFGLSLGLTIIAFTVAALQYESKGMAYSQGLLMIGLVLLAITQLVIQLLFFFHLGKETKPRLNTMSFLFMIMVVSIIGFGSLWIMYNLDYNMMPHEVDTYIQQEENIYRTKQGN